VLQRPRGWGLFLIKNMVDEINETTDEDRHTLELVMRFVDPSDVTDTERQEGDHGHL
jgi:hypothetical protein